MKTNQLSVIWSAFLLAIAFSTACVLMYSVAFYAVPKKPVDHNVFLLLLFVFIGFYLMLSRWLNRAQLQPIRRQENPSDDTDTSVLRELLGWVRGPNLIVSIGSALVAYLITICIGAAFAFSGIKPSPFLVLIFPVLYFLLRWIFHEPKKGGD